MEEMIFASCCSEKEKVGISFGFSYDTNEVIDSDEVEELISESFWENYQEFENGINKAKSLVEKNSEWSFRQALREVFGNFSVMYEYDGKEFVLKLDVNELMYDLLESV